jgi:hypothetical protein
VFRHAVYAATMLLAPVLLLPGTLFNPAVGGIGAGAANIAANATADPTTNQLHIAIYVVETFVLPFSVLGLASLALPRSPWLATVGAAFGLVGWLPWSALAAQDDLTFQMARLGGGPGFVELWNRFTTDPAMGSLTLIYVVCHLVAYVVLGIALGRAGAIPAWAAWSLALTSPITVLAFPTHIHALLYVVIGIWFAGSLPAARAVWWNRLE